MASSASSPLAFRLNRDAALYTLVGIGAVLSSIVLLDVYQDWIPEGKPLWTTLLENAVPLALALSIPALAWRMARKGRGEDYVSTTLRWGILGGAAMFVVAGLGLGFQLVQGRIEPLVFIVQISTAGALAGALVGYFLLWLNPGDLVDPDEAARQGAPLLGRTRLGMHLCLAMLLVIGGGLALVVLFDIYNDWVVRGTPLWATVAESSIPFMLALSLPAFGWRLAEGRRGRDYLSKATKWALAGLGSTLLVGGTVMGLQGVQGEIKPGIVFTQLSVLGTVAGLFVGRNVAGARQAQRRLRGLAQSVPGAVFQFEVQPDGTYTPTFVGDAFESIFGVSSDPKGFFDRFADRLPPSHRTDFLDSIESAIDHEEPWRFEVPFDTTGGERMHLQGTATPERRGNQLIFHGVFIDITERKAAEEQLDKTGQRFHVLFEKSGTPMILVEPETGDIEDANPAAVDFYGYDRDTLRSIGIQDLNQLSSKEAATRRTRAESTQQNRFVYPHQLSSGEVRMVEVHSTPVTVEGQPLLFSVVIDITEQQKRQRELERRNDLFAQTQAIANVGGWEYQVETDALTWTDEVYRIHGLSPSADVSPEDALQFFHPDDRPRVRRAFDQAVRRGEPYDLQSRIRTDDGTERWVRTQADPTIEEGSVVHVRGVFQDITEQKQRQQELKRLEGKYHGLLEEAPDAIFVANGTTGQILEANEAAASLLGLPVADIEGQHLLEIHPSGEQEKYRALFEKAGRMDRRQAISTFEDGSPVQVVTDAGDRVPVAMSTNVVRLEGQRIIVGIVRDVTERRAREARLVEAKEEAEHMNRLKSAFLANMSHEIRTPLTSIIGFAEVIGEEAREKNEAVAEFGRRIEKSGRQLLETLNGVLNLSKLEAGEMELDAGRLDVAEAASSVAEQLRPQAQDAGVALRVETDPEPVWAQANDGGLQIALRNLMSNAIKYTEEGEVVVRVRDERGPVVHIEDTGVGMPPEEEANLFEPFRQESEGMDRKYEGTGLGLAITKKAVEQMDGTIAVDTEKGQGTRFTIHLPQDPATNGAIEA